ncbi:MAG: S24 family peptidase [Alphaproteobacteria bacterium]|nr:S24 family peptidase [Alphaproteobacteria bacterium]
MDKQQQIRDFLENKIKEKGMSLNSLSLKLGKNSTYLFHFIKRKSPKRLDETARRKLALILEVSEQELCDFPLPSSIIQDKFSTISNLFNFGKTNTSDIVAIDVVDMDGPNKGRFEKVKNNIVGQEFMTSDVVKMYTSSDPRNIKIIKVSGEAMAPTINHGDIVWLDMSYSTPVSDGVYIINTAGDVVIRRLQINPFDNSIEVSADNKAYKAFNITDYKSLNICGKVVFISRRMS